ncbi:hypothetical protein GX411_01835 [Candidatus Fermentibacteria bacterium]|nr:hypothetical protein [Candidatus Fermentibacteria bacterium]
MQRVARESFRLRPWFHPWAVSASLLLLAGALSAHPVEDLVARGIPAASAALEDTAFVVAMEGSLTEGDTLLKRYGGVFFTLLDSISGGWPIVGLCVDIPGSRLRFSRVDMYEALDQMRSGVSDDRVALWVLQHTRVFNLQP